MCQVRAALETEAGVTTAWRAVARRRGRTRVASRAPISYLAASRIADASRCGSSVVEHSLGKGEVVGSIPPRSTIKARTSRSAIPATEQIVVRAYVNNRIQVRRVLPEDDSVAIGRRL